MDVYKVVLCDYRGVYDNGLRMEACAASAARTRAGEVMVYSRKDMRGGIHG